MRVSEIIRSILDVIDNAEQNQEISQHKEQVADEDIYNDEIRRIKQIADVRSGQQATEYSNSPAEEYASIEAVTTGAGGGPNKPKHPADLRGNSFRIYPGDRN